MRLLPICLFALSILHFSCKNSTSSPIQKAAEMSDLPKDFLNFYQQFHSDSLYQITHIEWPLKGEKAVPGADGLDKKVLTTWEPEAWIMQHQPDLAKLDLKRSVETISDVLIIERLSYPMVNYGMERQFYKDEDNEWRLIYYSEMQDLR
jgi:hypothetical protein